MYSHSKQMFVNLPLKLSYSRNALWENAVQQILLEGVLRVLTFDMRRSSKRTDLALEPERSMWLKC